MYVPLLEYLREVAHFEKLLFPVACFQKCATLSRFFATAHIWGSCQLLFSTFYQTRIISESRFQATRGVLCSSIVSNSPFVGQAH